MIKVLREKRVELAKEIRRLADLANDDKHTWAAEDKANWEKVNSDYNSIAAKIEKLERAESIEAELRDGNRENLPGREDRSWKGSAREEKDDEEDGGDGSEPGEKDSEDNPSDDGHENNVESEFRGKKNLLRGNEEEIRALAIQGWMRHQSNLDVSKKQFQACRRTGINLNRPYIDIPLHRSSEYRQMQREYRALTYTGTEAGKGGDTIPIGFVNRFERAMLAFGSVRQAAEVIRTASGNLLHWPKGNDTGNKGALLAEEGAATSQDIVTADFTLEAWKYTSKLIRVSEELLEDTAIDLVNMIGDMCGERIARGLNDDLTTGDGASKPKGIVAGCTLGTTTASATAITADEVIQFIHTVDHAYRGPGCGWMLHDLILCALRLLKGSDNNYLWTPGLIAGYPDRLCGYPYFVNMSMDSTLTATKKIALFGQLSAYKLRDIGSIRLRRLVERYAEYDQEGFVAFSRHDGDLLDAGTHPVRMLQMKA